jgi:hypothetical protein
MRIGWSLALPAPRNEYRGPAVTTWFLALYTLVATVRSFIHMLAPDGGAQSIAGLDVGVAGGSNIVALFGQWGLEQLLVALVGWAVLVRYRVFVPLVIGLAFLEQAGRFGIGQLKPIEAVGTPPGAVGTWILLPLTLLFFAVSIIERPDPED